MMRGGTSRGPFFLASDLPRSPAERDAVLLSVMGSGHPLEIDGIGGGHPLTSKVAIVGPSRVPGADIDYLFAQVKVTERLVDTSPNCGNMLAAVGPFAIEAGLVPIEDGVTRIRIHNVNTGKLILAEIQTPAGRVNYTGDAMISGVPGTGAPIGLTFLDAAGSKTGALLPTGRARDHIAGFEVTCIDAAMPVVLVRAGDLGCSGQETPEALNANRGVLSALEEIRVAAGAAMGIPGAADTVIPKPILLAPGPNGLDMTVRYFMPHSCHTALAITGSVALASACVTPGTLAHDIVGGRPALTSFGFGHPTGRLDVAVEKGSPAPKCSVIRTARRLFEGAVFAVPHRALAEAAA